MRIIKIFVLAAAAALATTAFVGAGSASAEIFCKVQVKNEASCPESSRYGSEITVNAGASLTFDVEGFEQPFKCSSSDLTMKTKTQNPGGPLTGQLTALSFGGCNFATWCKGAQAERLPYKTEIQATGEGDGTLTLSSGGNGKPAITLLGCKWGIYPESNCTYSASKVELGFKGPYYPTVIEASGEQFQKESGGNSCFPLSLKVSGNYALDQSFSASASSSTLSSEWGPTVWSICTASMGGEFNGSITSHALSNCQPKECQSAEVQGLPDPTSFASTGSGDGTLEISNVSWKLTGCTFFKVTCIYEATKAVLDVVDGKTIVASKEPLTRSGGGLCHEVAQWDATYTINTGASKEMLWVIDS